jgi:hypothetical protein
MGRNGLVYAAVLLCGVIRGLLLHRIEDLCTRKAITSSSRTAR